MRSRLTAATISLAFTLFLTPLFIRLFEKLGWGQVIRTPENAHNPNHHAKRGTPTMGGVIFILGSIVGYLVGTLTGGSPPSISGLLVIWMMVGLGAIGFIAAMAVSSTLVDVSPCSTNGALVLASAQGVDRDAFFRKLLAYGAIVTVVAPVLVWLLFVVL